MECSHLEQTGHSAAASQIRQSGWGDWLSRRFWFLEGPGLCDEARRRTGLMDFGEPGVEPALSILTDSLEAEANLHPLGRYLMRVHLRELLETRLRLAEHWRGQADALGEQPIERPVFITGMPRSGSTFLHELLSEDPEHRAPRVYEVMFPVPSPALAPGGRDPRIRRAAACLWWFRRLAPEADAVFPMRALTPHECVAIHSYTFLSQEFISTCRIPRYEAFLRAADLRPAYAWQRRFLQHLQLGRPVRRWVLKSPDHVYGLAELFDVFPDAVVIQTHRNPIDVLNSSYHLTEVLHGLFTRPGSAEALGAREARILAEGVELFIRFRDAHPELAERFIDVSYTELVGNPLATVRRIYRQLGAPLSARAEERMRRLIPARTRYRRSHARRAATDLVGFVRGEAPRFAQYCARFSIPTQPTGTG
ncbi:MAG TPA: sulfotransferase [Candidatus Acidoferrum sp.]|nr:sulfotransferase [Candidatus Acidoferrum sp.]